MNYQVLVIAIWLSATFHWMTFSFKKPRTIEFMPPAPATNANPLDCLAMKGRHR